MIPIDLGSALKDASASNQLRAILGDTIWLSETNREAASPPSDDIIASVLLAFTFTKESIKRQRLLLTAACVFAALGVAALIGAYVANKARREAELRARVATSRQLSSEALTFRDEHLDLAALLSLEAYRIYPTVEARSSVLAAIEHRPRLLRLLHGDPEIGMCLAISYDGRALASGNVDGTITIWNVSETELASTFQAHKDTVWTVAFGPDGTMLASACDNGEIALWDVRTRKAIGTALKRHSGSVYSVTFSPDGKHLTSAGRDRKLIVWDVERREPRLIVQKAHSGAIWSVAYSPDGRMVATGSSDHTVNLWDTNSLRRLGPPLRGHGDLVNSVAFSQDGTLLASGSHDGTVILWSLMTHRYRIDRKHSGWLAGAGSAQDREADEYTTVFELAEPQKDFAGYSEAGESGRSEAADRGKALHR